MGRITAIRSGKRSKKRVDVFLDGEFALSLDAEVAVKEKLEVGQELSASRIADLAGKDRFHSCFSSAIRYLEYRPRSESELKMRLRRRGFDAENIEAVIAKLKEQGLVNDLAFAEFWKENRETFSPRSQRMTELELRQKGVAGDIIDQVVYTIDDKDSAYRAALGKARRLSVTDYRVFRRRLGEYLRRRGFGYEVIGNAVERIWQEKRAESGASPCPEAE